MPARCRSELLASHPQHVTTAPQRCGWVALEVVMARSKRGCLTPEQRPKSDSPPPHSSHEELWPSSSQTGHISCLLPATTAFAHSLD